MSIRSDRLERLFSKKSNHIKPGLERMRDALPFLSIRDVPTILVAGTNGKGSMAGWLWLFIKQKILKAGIYSSPHILNFSERIQVSELDIVDEDYIFEVLEVLKKVIPFSIYEELSFYEIATLLALQIFDSLGVGFRVLEIGLGGRLDACNAIEPDISIVTSIDLDHTEWLGETLNCIASEKLAIGRESKPLIWLEDAQTTAAKKLEGALFRAQEKIGFELIRLDHEFTIGSNEASIRWPRSKERTYILPEWIKKLTGFHKRYAALSLLINKHMNADGLQKKDKTVIDPRKSGLPFSHMGRRQKSLIECQLLKEIVFDVSHNPAALSKTLESLEFQSGLAVYGFLKDKEIHKMLDILKNSGFTIWGFKLNSPRSYLWQEESSQRNTNIYSDFASLWHSLHNTRQIILNKPLLVGGSFVAVGQALEYFMQNKSNATLYDSQHLQCPICSECTV